MFLRVACDIGFPRSINAATRNQTAGKTDVRQCRNWASPGPVIR
jgi:hypothetical protein